MESLNCKICIQPFNKNFKIPYILPCGHCFCKKCLEVILEKKGKLVCPLDNKESPIELENLNPNYTLLELLDDIPLDVLNQQKITPKEYAKQEQQKEVDFTCENHPFKEAEFVCEKHGQLLCINCAWKHTDHRQFVREYSQGEMRQEAKATADNFQKLSDEITLQIQQLEILSGKEKVSSDEFRKVKQSLQDFVKKNLSNKMRNLIEIGQQKLVLETTIAENPEDQAQIMEWLNQPDAQLELIYKSSRDGFSAQSFHTKCDGQGPTLTIAKANNHVVGGYNPQSWSSNGQYTNDGQAWLFTMKEKKKLTCSKNIQNACYNNNGYGPTFGGGHDFYVSSTGQNSYSNLGYSYSCEGVQQGNQNFFCGQYQFFVSEYEVFKITK